jgi:hypothetical protein
MLSCLALAFDEWIAPSEKINYLHTKTRNQATNVLIAVAAMPSDVRGGYAPPGFVIKVLGLRPTSGIAQRRKERYGRSETFRTSDGRA